MAKGKWEVFSSFIGRNKVYRVGRIIDTSEPLHSGNVEYSNAEFWADENEAQKVAKQMNGS